MVRHQTPFQPLRRRITAALAAFVAAFLVAATPSDSKVRVRHVIDGDTIVLESGEHVRLTGIDAPEYTLWKNNVEPYGKEASEYLKRLLDGKNVRLESDVEKSDRFGRTLAYVYLEDGRMANRLIVRDGLARARTYSPNDTYRHDLELDEREAAAKQKGLWAQSAR